MARIRSIKPEFWQDELVGSLPVHARLLFIGLWTIADDEGRFRANPRFVASQVFPYDSDIDVRAALQLLQARGRVQLYEADGQAFGWIRRFSEHQRIDKPKASALPSPPPQEASRSVVDASPTNPGRVVDASETSPGRKGVEGSGEEGSGREAPPPPPAEERRGVPRVVEAPDSPPEAWVGDDFWRWFQSKRQEAGFVAEKPPHPAKLGAWWSEATGTVRGDVLALKQAVYRFGEDKYWQARDPPLPFQAFMAQWAKYAPRREADDARP